MVFKKKTSKNKESFGDLLQALFSAIFLAILIRGFLFEPFKIPSESMVPTLMIGDHIFVKRYEYGLRIPFTNAWLMEFDGPERGDVVVFSYPKDDDVNYIKRVIGVPGDEIEMKNDQLFVNGKKVAFEKIGIQGKNKDNHCQSVVEESSLNVVPQDSLPIAFNRSFDQFQYKTESLDGKKYLIQSSHYAPQESTFKIKVPDRQYFVLGDNRDQSRDSRFWGFVPRHLLKGKAKFIWLSLNSEGVDCPYDGAYNWIGKSFGIPHFPSVRWDRFGKSII